MGPSSRSGASFFQRNNESNILELHANSNTELLGALTASSNGLEIHVVIGNSCFEIAGLQHT